MDWSNELYVKVYTRETADDLALTWEARALWLELLKKFDRSGTIETRRGEAGLAALIRWPLEVVERALPELLEDGRVRLIPPDEPDGPPRGFIAPNFIPAQETRQTDAARQRRSREQRRARNIDSRHQLSHDVTIRSDQIRSDEKRTDSSRACDPTVQLPEQAAQQTTTTVSTAVSTAAPVPVAVAETAHSNVLVLPLAVVPDGPPPDLRVTPGPSAVREDIRRRLWNEAWQFAGLQQVELQAEGIDANARNSWTGLPAAGSFEARALFARIDELLIGDKPDVARVRDTLRNRILVAAAEARHTLRHLRFFSPARMWDEKSFAIASALTPKQVEDAAAARASPARASPHAEAPRRLKTL